MKEKEINDLVSKYADELYEGYDMADFQNEENKETVTVICAAFLGHILEAHDIIPKSPEAKTIYGYVARDANGVIGLYQSCPRRLLIDKVWDSDYGVFEIPQDSFPSVTWESKPLKVKLPITPTEDE